MIEATILLVVEVMGVLEVLVLAVMLVVAAGTLTLSERVQRQAGLTRLDGEQALPLQVEQMLLLDLLDLQELLLEGQLLRRHLLLVACMHTHTQTHKKTHTNTDGKTTRNAVSKHHHIQKQSKHTFQVCTLLDTRLFSKSNRTFSTPSVLLATTPP